MYHIKDNIHCLCSGTKVPLFLFMKFNNLHHANQGLGGHEAISQHAKEMLDFGEKLLLDSFHVAPAPFPQSMRAPYLRIVGEY